MGAQNNAAGMQPATANRERRGDGPENEMKWWGSHNLSKNHWGRWRIGPLDLFAKPAAAEWQVAYRQLADPLDATLEVEARASSEPVPETYEFSRYAMELDGPELELKPRLGDRPFIVSPGLPLYLPAGQKVVLYVSTVVWIQIIVPKDSGNVLVDVPTIRRSDTWFGPNTRQGELCYATKTNARTELDAIEPRPHRAVTPVEIRNEGVGMLPIEQLRVPVPALSIYADKNDSLWTDAVCFVREEGEDDATITTPEPSAHLPGKRKLIEGPRAPVQTGTIVKAFSKLLT